MNKIQNGWFSEVSTLWPGQALSIEVEEVLFEGKSQYQDLVVFKSKTYGNVLVLDGAIQLTERDEFAYQEMIAHLPLLSHPNPERVCVIGGGDGAVVSQILKHKSVKEIHLCEIDQLVIDKSKEYFPQFAKVFSDPRLKIVLADGVKYLDNLTQPEFDVIIVDSSDPIGPANVLFEENFYAIAKKAVKEGGIICSQSECIWLHLELIKNMVTFARKLFVNAEYAFTTIPTYPSGQIGFLLCSVGEKKDGQSPKVSCRTPKRTVKDAFIEGTENSLRYYHSDIHSASFVLPAFAKALSE